MYIILVLIAIVSLQFALMYWLGVVVGPIRPGIAVRDDTHSVG
jgi:hypothetical protein